MNHVIKPNIGMLRGATNAAGPGPLSTSSASIPTPASANEITSMPLSSERDIGADQTNTRDPNSGCCFGIHSVPPTLGGRRRFSAISKLSTQSHGP